MAIQAELANKLKRTGVPVILLGDFNERDEAYCSITGNSDLEAVNGGGWPNGRCDPPSWMRIDWIFASPSVRVDWTTSTWRTRTPATSPTTA